MAKIEATTMRMAAQFQVVRYAVIHAMAKAGISTQTIADKLKMNRSYVIRMQVMDMQPMTPQEKALMKAAAEYEPQLRKLGMGYAFGEGIETTLAGGDRMSLPPEQRGGRPSKDAKPKAKAPKAKAAKSQAKPASKAKPAKAKAAAKPKASKPAQKAATKAQAKPAKAKVAKLPKVAKASAAPASVSEQADLLTSLPEAA